MKTNYIKEFLWSKGKISSKRVYALMMFVNAIVLGYIGGPLELIKAFLYSGLVLAGVTGVEKVLQKQKNDKDEGDEQ